MTRIALALLFIALVLLAWWAIPRLWIELKYRRARRQRSGKAMKDAARGLGNLAEAVDFFTAREKLTVDQNLSDAEVWGLVESLLDPDRRLDHERVRLLGARAAPQLIRALDSPRFVSAISSDGVDTTVPLERVISLLGASGSADAIPDLIRLLHHSKPAIRRDIALALGEIGGDDCIQPLRDALSDSDKLVPGYVTIGIRRSLNAARASTSFRRAMFEALLPRACGEQAPMPDNAALCLLELDLASAARILASRRALHIENPALADVLYALIAFNVSIDDELAWSLWQQVELKDASCDWEYVQRELLCVLGRAGDRRALPHIEQALDSTNDRTREYAASALAVLHGVAEPGEYVFERKHESGIDGLTAAQRTVYLIADLEAEVNNGGFSQYFFNSAGAHAQETAAALQAIGASRTLAILRRAIDVFGSRGPSRDRELRMKQYASLNDHQEKLLDDLSSEFYEDKDRLHVLLARFAIAHAADFPLKRPTRTRDGEG